MKEKKRTLIFGRFSKLTDLLAQNMHERQACLHKTGPFYSLSCSKETLSPAVVLLQYYSTSANF